MTDSSADGALDRLEAAVLRRERRTRRGAGPAVAGAGVGLAVLALWLPWRVTSGDRGHEIASGPGSVAVVVVVVVAMASVAFVWRDAWMRYDEEEAPAWVALVAGLLGVTFTLLSDNADRLVGDGSGAAGPWLALIGFGLVAAGSTAALARQRDVHQVDADPEVTVRELRRAAAGDTRPTDTAT